MVHLEEWMSIHEMHQLGISQSQIARQLGLDRKTVRKYLHSPPGSYGPRRKTALVEVTPRGPC